MSRMVFAFALALFAAYSSAQTRPAVEFVGDARIGVCTHFAQGWDSSKIMPMVETTGVGWIRDDLDWSHVEQTQGQYKIPDNTLAWIRSVHAHHIRLLLILNGANKLYADPYDATAFAKWAGWVARELRNDVDALEIMNEPNNFGFSKHYGGKHEGEGDSPWVAQYVKVMNAAAEAIKAANPTVPVIGFGAGTAVTYKQLGMTPSPAVDAIADHPYSTHTPPETVPAPSIEDQRKRFGFAYTDEANSFTSLVQGFRTESAKYKGPKQLWLTEFGYSTFQPLTPGQFSGFTEEAQARYILRRLAQGLGLGVEVSVIYEFMDGRDPHDAEDGFGLMRVDGQPKLSADAVRNFSAAMRNFRVAKESEVGAVNVFPAAVWPQPAAIAVYRFVDASNHPGALIWATDRAGSDLQPRVGDIELLWGPDIKQLTAIDTLTGDSRSVKFTSTGGRTVASNFTIRDYPILLTSSSAASGASVAGVKPLNLFDKGAAWTFIDGREFPGAAGSFSLAGEADKHVGVLNYDFTKGGAYVAAHNTTLSISNQAAELRVGVKSTQRQRLSIRLIDVTGQCHQYVTACNGGDWETLRVPLDRKSGEHWAGANDGRIHFPVHGLSLCVSKTTGGSGAVQFADVVTVAK